MMTRNDYTDSSIGSTNMFIQPVLKADIGTKNITEFLPNPNIPTSFTYTTLRSEDDVISIQGPFQNETVLLIAIQANRYNLFHFKLITLYINFFLYFIVLSCSDVSADVVVATKTSAVNLLSGISMNGFVDTGSMV